ncbi:MmpS family transport accessory protein [Leifsonia sp. YAF41]|uniref:MmpS family transport accessory protein n=1 Tax=Leifsonia sp. YAF41 TaxID=3233086 RepID=UPI003F9990EE
MTTTQQPAAPVPAEPQPKTGNGLGVAALIIGIIALVGAFIPFLNYGTGFIAFIGLVLGIIGLVRKGKKKGVAIAGTIISGLALILSIVMAMVYTAAFAAGVSASIDESNAKADRDIVVLYEITGAATNASITYSTFNDGTAGSEQSTGQTLPFTKELTAKAGNEWDFSSFSLTGSNGVDDTGDIACKITVDGEVVSEQTSTGQFASVMCSSSGTSE